MASEAIHSPASSASPSLGTSHATSHPGSTANTTSIPALAFLDALVPHLSILWSRALTLFIDNQDIAITCAVIGLTGLVFLLLRRLSKAESDLKRDLSASRDPLDKESTSNKMMPTNQAPLTTFGLSEEDIRARSSLPNYGYGDVRVARILVHPIKSCRGTSVQSARYTPQGIEHDRKWAIIDATTTSIITARDVGKMVLITPKVQVDESSPYGGLLTVSFPADSGCETFSVPLNPSREYLRSWTMLPKVTIWPNHEPVDGYICQSVSPTGSNEVTGLPNPSTELSKFMGRPVHLLFKGPGDRYIDPTMAFPDLKATAQFQDMYPLLVLSEESVDQIEGEVKQRVGTQGIEERWKQEKVIIQRFRPNITFSGGGPFAEDGWEEIEIGPQGSPVITLVSRCTRCLLPNVSPETGVRDQAVPYKVIMKFRTGLDPKSRLKPCVGCNAVPAGHGVVTVGDQVRVKKLFSRKF